MSYIEEILAFNALFAENEDYHSYTTTKYPDKKMAVLSCMDTRLTELLPAALNIKNGDVKIIKNAGAMVTHAFGSVMRSLLIAIYELDVEEIMVIGHHDCGMQHLNADTILQKMLARGVTTDTLNTLKYSGIDTNHWLEGFDSAEASVIETVDAIKHHPLVPKDIIIQGFIIDPLTGKLDVLTDK